MKSILLLSLYDPTCEHFLLKDSKIGLQAAASRYQWNLIEGFRLLAKRSTVISSYPIGTYPFYCRKLFYRSYKQDINPLTELYYVGFLNLPIIRDVYRCIQTDKLIKNMLKSSSSFVLFIYGFELGYIRTVILNKKKYGSRCKTVLIVPDLPGKNGIQRSFFSFHGIWDRLFVKLKFSMLKSIDAYVLLTQPMKEVLNLNNTKNICVVEGFSNPQSIDHSSIKNRDLKVILYTGSLNQNFGIKHMIESFLLINKKEYCLWICGSGDCRNFVKNICTKHKNIRFFGFLEKKMISKLQQRATALINPRKNDGAYTKFSFPSKTIEYLETGKPVIMYKLDGVPDEYDDYLFYVNDNTTFALADKMVEICSLNKNELTRHSIKVQKWLQHNKNCASQVQKILNMVKEVS